MKISKRAEKTQESPIRKFAPYAEEARKRGIHIYHLNIGQPDIETFPEVWDAMKKFSEKILKYGPSGGLAELRLEVVNYHKSKGIDLDIDNVWITQGGSEAILFALWSVCDPGDEVIVFEPFYTNYNGFASASSVKLVPVTGRVENGFHLPPDEEIEKKITQRTKAILICNPNNPTGTVYTRAEIFRLVELAKKYDLFLIADEVYREFVYDGKVHTSLLSIEGIEDRVIVTDSTSKRFSMCGARIGTFISRNKDIMRAALKFAQARLCPPTLEQIGALHAYRNFYKYEKSLIKKFQKRRDLIYNALSKMKGVFVHKPEGAFYTVVKLPVDNSENFVKFLLKDFHHRGETVMLSPASGFYATEGMGVDQVRIAYVLETGALKRAMEILSMALEVYPGKRE